MIKPKVQNSQNVQNNQNYRFSTMDDSQANFPDNVSEEMQAFIDKYNENNPHNPGPIYLSVNTSYFDEYDAEMIDTVDIIGRFETDQYREIKFTDLGNIDISSEGDRAIAEQIEKAFRSFDPEKAIENEFEGYDYSLDGCRTLSEAHEKYEDIHGDIADGIKWFDNRFGDFYNEADVISLKNSNEISKDQNLGTDLGH